MYAVSDATRAADPCLSPSQANASDPSPIQVCLFGGLTLLKKGEPIAWRGGAKTEALLLSLALEESRGVCRERLLSQLWPDSEPSLAAQSLHSLLHSLHRLLGDAIGGAPPVVHTAEIYRINVRAGIAVDVAAFEALARRGDRHWQAGACQPPAATTARRSRYIGAISTLVQTTQPSSSVSGCAPRTR